MEYIRSLRFVDPVECLLVDNLGGVVLDNQNHAKCTAWLAFTMVSRCAVAASDGYAWIRTTTLPICYSPHARHLG